MMLKQGWIQVFQRRHKIGLWLLMVCSVGLLTPSLAAAQNYLQDVRFSSQPGNKIEVALVTSEPVGQTESFTTDDPARIVIDLLGVKSSLDRKNKPIGVGVARSVTAIEAKDRTRVVINLIDSVPHKIVTENNRIFVSISGGSGSGSLTETNQSTAATSIEGRVQSDSFRIENIDFRRGPTGEGKVVIDLSDPRVAIDLRETGGSIVLEFIDTELPLELARTLDVTDFATPVAKVFSRPDGKNVRIEVKATGEFEHLAYQANDIYTLEFRPLSRDEVEQAKKERLIYTGERLSLNFQDIEVRAVLQLLSDFTGLNMVVSDTVSGRITLRLKNVPWDQAMDIILRTKGLSMRKNDNVVLVAPTEEISQREKLEFESQQQIEELAPLRSQWVRLNYARAQVFADFLNTESNPFLSERGSVTFDHRTNTLLIRDTASNLDQILEIVNELDVPVRQVLIESRVVIANNDFATDLGVRLGLSAFADLSGDRTAASFSGGLPGDIDFGGTTALESPGGSGNEALLVNLPQTLAAGSGGVANFIIGRVGTALLRLELSAMEQEGRGEIISSPRVITANQSKAIIKQGVEVPYQEASSSGATTVSFKEAVLSLEVTPQITPDDRIIMDLKINQDTPDFARAVLGVPPVDTREIDTEVIVDNGETVVLGGVFEREKTTTTAKVPFFGDLPVVGFAFRQRQIQDENSELIIFVTPKILKETLTLN